VGDVYTAVHLHISLGDSLVEVVSRLRVWMIWAYNHNKNKGLLSFPKCLDRPWGPLSFPFNGYRISFLGGESAGP